jgi:caa(3)-type oxidase subunit IV
MSSSHRQHYLTIWYWLMALVVISVALSAVLPKTQALALIFIIAVVKALLVARNFMHMKSESAIIYALALVPLAFVVIFLFGLFPDFVYHATKP